MCLIYVIFKNDMIILLMIILIRINLIDVYSEKNDIYGRASRFFYNLLSQLINYDKRNQQVCVCDVKFDNLTFGVRDIELIRTDNSNLKVICLEFDSTKG